MKRRTRIKIISLFSAGIISLFCWGYAAKRELNTYKTQSELTRQRALMGLCENFNEMDVCLQKSLYADNGTLSNLLARKLSAQSVGAKANLSSLDTGDVPLSGIYKFLSQVSEYAAALSVKAANGENLCEEERNNLEKLENYAATLYSRFSYLNELNTAGVLSFDKLENELQKTDDQTADTVSFLSLTGEAEEAMGDYPTLIYDGPFSDNILKKESAVLNEAVEISKDAAKRKAARVFAVEEKYLSEAGESEGKIAGYLFSYDNRTVSVTKKGGYIAYILSQGLSGTQKLTVSDGVEAACTFLNTCGYTDMKATYQEVFNGICTVNFAYIQAGYICYPDLIKVSVDLSNAKVISMDASDFLMNHITRSIPTEQVTPDGAKEKIPDNLTLKQLYRAVIPTPSGGEKFTFEALCENKNGAEILVYIDTASGIQDDILLLLSNENSTVTK